jgi:hypothetical protein
MNWKDALKAIGSAVGTLLVKAGTYAVEHPDQAIAVAQAIKDRKK